MTITGMALIEPKSPEITPPPTVEAAQTASPSSAPPESPAAAPGAGGALPDALIQVPAMQAVMAGQPPAFSANIKQFASNPVAKLITQNKDSLMKAGMGFYQSLSGDLGVMFNQMYIHPEDVQAADKAGQLLKIAPPFDAINASVGQAGLDSPALKVGSMPGGAAMPTMKAPPQMSNGGQMGTPSSRPAATGPAMSPASSAIERQVMGVRAKNVSPGSPTSGSSPGAGRLLNQILKTAV